MTPEEAKKAFEELKQEGMDEDDLVAALGKMYEKGDIEKDQLEDLLGLLGYEFTDEFKGLSDEESKKGLWASDEGEPEGEGGEKAEEPEGGPEEEGESEEDEDSEGEERKKAFELFGR